MMSSSHLLDYLFRTYSADKANDNNLAYIVTAQFGAVPICRDEDVCF